MVNKLLIFVGIVVISGLLVFAFQKSSEQKKTRIDQNSIKVVEKCGEECERKIRELVAEAVATLAAKPVQKTSTKTTDSSSAKPQTVPASRQVEYIPIGGAGSTTQRDWADLQNTDFYLDIGEYGRTEEVRWTANLKVMHGNGQAFTRIFDVTHGIGVQGTEISTTSQNFTLVESGQVGFFSGKNRYRVQVKSLTGYEAFFDSGRIKIVTE